MRSYEHGDLHESDVIVFGSGPLARAITLQMESEGAAVTSAEYRSAPTGVEVRESASAAFVHLGTWLGAMGSAVGDRVRGAVVLSEGAVSPLHAELAHQIDTQFAAAWELAVAMRANGGSVVIVGEAISPGRGWTAFQRSLVPGLTGTLATRAAPMNVRVNAVISSAREPEVGPPMRWLLGRAPQHRDVAMAVAFLVSDNASFVSGICLPVDSGGPTNATRDVALLSPDGMRQAQPIRRALVAGGAGGIGSAIVAQLVKSGYQVGCADIDKGRAVKVAEALGSSVVTMETDATNEESVRACYEQFCGSSGLTLLVNSIGMNGPVKSPGQISVQEWQQSIDVNLTSVFLMSKHGYRHLAADRGAIINVSSALAFAPWPLDSAYGHTKAAVVALSRSHALDFAPEVRVNCVCPGATRTSMTVELLDGVGSVDDELAEYGRIHPLGHRLCEPQEVARVVDFLASEKASAITGAAVPVDGAFLARWLVEGASTGGLPTPSE